MKYQIQVEINQPRSKVVERFDNPDNMHKWQEGLISFKNIEGKPGEVGTKSKLHYKMGGREMEMIETITERQLPERFCGTYEVDKTYNIVENTFIEKDQNTTLWTVNTEFKSESIMMKLMMFFMPGAFKKQTNKFMQDFKSFAESATNE